MAPFLLRILTDMNCWLKARVLGTGWGWISYLMEGAPSRGGTGPQLDMCRVQTAPDLPFCGPRDPTAMSRPGPPSPTMTQTHSPTVACARCSFL